MIRNSILGYFYNERFGENNKETFMAFQNIIWSLIAHKNIIKNCVTALQAFHLRSLSLSFYPLFHFS